MTDSEIRIVRTVAGAYGDMDLYSNGVIRFTSDDGLFINEKVVRRTDAEFHELAGGPYVTVLDFRPAGFANRDARNLAALETDTVAMATAIVLGQEIGHWLANNWMRETRPARPVGIFDDLDEAMTWASEQATALLG